MTTAIRKYSVMLAALAVFTGLLANCVLAAHAYNHGAGYSCLYSRGRMAVG